MSSNKTFKSSDVDFEDRFVTWEEFRLPKPNITNRQLWTWGGNGGGSLGHNDTIDKSSPVQIGAVNTWGSFSCGSNHIVAVTRAGALFSWGTNDDGKLGLNSGTVARSSPSQIGTDTNWSVPSSGLVHTACIKTDGSLWTWGNGPGGRLGLVTTVNRSSPVQVAAGPTENNWYDVSAGAGHTTAVTRDGSLWAWGVGDNGRLGLNATISRSNPVQIGTSTDWRNVSSWYHSLSIKTDGTLWVWGPNTNGALGLNNSIYRSSPVQIDAGSQWKQAFARNATSIAIKTDGTLWVWGNNTDGNLGLNSAGTVHRSSPTQLGTRTDWAYASVGHFNAFAVSTDGSLWSWGFGSVTGQNTTIARSSPSQVGTLTNWKNVNAGTLRAIASRLA
jgi:alpha-tubulin suppressor-like RCC1 family protein